MHPSEVGATLLMGLFAIGVLGCVVTIPLCAYKFFRVLAEKDTGEDDAGPPAAPPSLPQEAIAAPEMPVVPAMIPVQAERAPLLVHSRRVVPKRYRRPRRTAGKYLRF